MALVAAAGLVACGGDDSAESADPNELLKQTFTGKKDIKSGKLGVNIDVNVKGAGADFSGPIKITLGGPFESQGTGKLPKFDLDLVFNGAGQNIRAGATSTGDKGFVNFNGQDYVVSDQIFQAFKSSFEQASKQGQGQDQSLKSLGLDPQRWLTDPKNEGEAKVGDADTIKITGKVDVGRLLEDVNNALGKLGSLGLQGQAGLPSRLTDEQKKQVAEAVDDLSVDIFTGKDDKILRRIVIALKISEPGEGKGSADVRFDLSLLDLNEGQEFQEPQNAKPFDELLQNLGPLLGGLGGGAAQGSGSGSGCGGGGGGGDGSGGGGGSQQNLEEYTKCIEDAGNDVQKAQECAGLLTR